MIEEKSGKAKIEQISIEQLRIISDNFTRELRDAQDGKKTSLAFIVHELSPSPIVQDGEIFESLIIGGTVAKTALLKKNGSKFEILQEEKRIKLSIGSEEDFLAFVNSTLPENVNALAFNFAYPLKPVFENGKLDGVLLEVSKESKFRGLIGKQIGKEIENYVFKKSKKKVKVAVANDTICLILSGLSKFKRDELAGGIVGTGMNFAIFTNKGHLVNLETAGFDKFTQTSTGKVVNQETNKPGKSLFEKETAGKYLYKHFNIVAKENNLPFPSIKSTKELNNISFKNLPVVSEIAQGLIARSAQLVACQIAGIAKFKKQNMVFNMEGSLFWKGNNYQKTVEETVKQLVPEYKIDFVEIENSAILGAAKLIC